MPHTDRYTDKIRGRSGVLCRRVLSQVSGVGAPGIVRSSERVAEPAPPPWDG